MATTEQRETIQKIFAGIFFIVGVVLIFFVIFTISKDKGLGQSRFNISVLFRHVGGLSEGAPVHLSGVNIGTVESVDFLKEPVNGRNVQVILGILEKYRAQFKGNVRFAISTQGILGEKLIEIYRTSYGPTIDLAAPVPTFGEDPVDVQDLAVVFSEAASSFTVTARKLGEIDLEEMAKLMADSSRSLLETSEGINEVVGEFNDISRKSKRLLNRLEEKVIEGDLFRFF